jgi:hypothetical protein
MPLPRLPPLPGAAAPASSTLVGGHKAATHGNHKPIVPRGLRPPRRRLQEGNDEGVAAAHSEEACIFTRRNLSSRIGRGSELPNDAFKKENDAHGRHCRWHQSARISPDARHLPSSHWGTELRGKLASGVALPPTTKPSIRGRLPGFLSGTGTHTPLTEAELPGRRCCRLGPGPLKTMTTSRDLG